MKRFLITLWFAALFSTLPLANEASGKVQTVGPTPASLANYRTITPLLTQSSRRRRIHRRRSIRHGRRLVRRHRRLRLDRRYDGRRYRLIRYRGRYYIVRRRRY